jgi:hypothetical protein
VRMHRDSVERSSSWCFKEQIIAVVMNVIGQYIRHPHPQRCDQIIPKNPTKTFSQLPRMIWHIPDAVRDPGDLVTQGKWCLWRCSVFMPQMPFREMTFSPQQGTR